MVTDYMLDIAYILLRDVFLWILEIIKHPFFISLMTYFVFDAVIQYKRIIGEVDSKLLFYQNIITISIDTDILSARKLECSRELRKLTGDLSAAYNAVFIKWFLSFIKVIPYEKDFQEAVKELGSLSNRVFLKDKNKGESIKQIRKLLKIPPRW